MKTVTYNPSTIEIQFAEAISGIAKDLKKKMKNIEITSVDTKLTEDNPLIIFKIKDNDGDAHEIVLKVIQRQDQ